jgi:hypothetical protein
MRCHGRTLGPLAAMHWLLGCHHHTHALALKGVQMGKCKNHQKYEYELMTHENVFTS